MNEFETTRVPEPRIMQQPCSHSLRVGGVVSTTGISGLTLGGGYGWLSTKYGLTCDNLVSADLLTASGELLHVTDETNPELMWGLRGAGANFGVVTSFEFRLHPVRPLMLAGLLAVPNDGDGARYRETYFETYPGVWRHGDWVTVTERNTVIVHGRSDSTLNRNGIRIGTADIYRVVEELPEVAEALVIGAEQQNGEYWMPLFVTLSDHAVLDDALRSGLDGRVDREDDEALADKSLSDQDDVVRVLIPAAPVLEEDAGVLGLRRGKGMLLDPSDPDTRSAGSFFTNPVLSAAA